MEEKDNDLRNPELQKVLKKRWKAVEICIYIQWASREHSEKTTRKSKKKEPARGHW